MFYLLQDACVYRDTYAHVYVYIRRKCTQTYNVYIYIYMFFPDMVHAIHRPVMLFPDVVNAIHRPVNSCQYHVVVGLRYICYLRISLLWRSRACYTVIFMADAWVPGPSGARATLQTQGCIFVST